MAVTIKADKRDNHSKSATNALRMNGYVPGVVYGKGKETKSIAVNGLELVKTIRDEGRNAIFKLEVENDKPVEVMLHDYQMDTIKNDLLHVDFYIVDMSEEMDVQVPVRIEGEALGAKEGGVLQQPVFELLVRAKPANIPDEIVVDVSGLNIGDVLTVADLPVSDKYEFLEEADTSVATVLAPTTSDETEGQADEEQPAEPELVGDKQKETHEE